MRLLFCLMVCLLLASGCGPTVSREDLGTILDEIPEVPGAEKPFKLPELNQPAGKEADSAGQTTT